MTGEIAEHAVETPALDGRGYFLTQQKERAGKTPEWSFNIFS